MKLITLSIGDENHEPTQAEIKEVKDAAKNAVPKEYQIIAYPYYIDLNKFDDIELETGTVQKIQKKIIDNVKAETEVQIQ